MMLVVRKPAFCIVETKAQISCTVVTAQHQHPCFCFIDSTIPLRVLPRYKISTLQPSPEAVQPVFCVGPGWQPGRPVLS